MNSPISRSAALALYYAEENPDERRNRWHLDALRAWLWTSMFFTLPFTPNGWSSCLSFSIARCIS
jgi:hypothetical protein